MSTILIIIIIYAIARPSVVCRQLVVVCDVRAPRTLLRRLKFSGMLLRHLVPWPSVTFR